jgi:hypothetical protein
MGFLGCYWGEKNNPANQTNDADWELTTVRVSALRYGHSPDKRGERTDKWGKAPIHVKQGWSGLVVHNGNDRLYYAKQRGDTHIQAWVKRN